MLSPSQRIIVAQRISVKARTFKAGEGAWLDYYANCEFDWLAIVLLPGPGQLGRRFFIAPKTVTDERLHHPKGKDPKDKYCRLDKVAKVFSEFENNFQLTLPMRNGRDEFKVAHHPQVGSGVQSY
jgi:hypothetical protein